MKLVNKPEIIREKVSIPLKTSINLRNVFKGKSVFEYSNFTPFQGRILYKNIFIESDVEFPLGVKIPSLMIPGENYEFFGLIPIQRIGNVTEFTVDYFEI